MYINSRIGYLQDWITQLWVKATGRRIDPVKDAWLLGPVGGTETIGIQYLVRLAESEGLEVVKNKRDSGLIDNFNDLRLSKEERHRLHPRIIELYEKTSNFDFDVWSEWCGFFRPFGWLLSRIFSRRLQQLNLPISAIDSSKGIQSNIIKLVEKPSGQARWTAWYRILKSTHDVLYSGIYTTCEIPNQLSKFMKVIFPLPNGNATVVMRAEVPADGSLTLHSDGKMFGDCGFYFKLTDHGESTGVGMSAQCTNGLRFMLTTRTNFVQIMCFTFSGSGSFSCITG